MTKIIYIDIDSLRADHVGTYGYSKNTTPEIDRVATDGVRFDNAYVANSPCMPSRAALMSGRYGADNGVETHGPLSQTLNTPAHSIQWAGSWSDHTDDRPWWRLPELFFKNDIYTVAVSSFPRHPAPWFYHLWDTFHQPREPTGPDESFQTPRAENVVDTAIKVVNRLADSGKDFFLYVQMWDPHAPYNRTDNEIDHFADKLTHPYPTAEQIDTHREWDAWRSASHMSINDRSDLRRLVAGYDAEIAYADAEIGRLIDRLERHGLYADTTITITGDHGEEFGEHGLYREHWSTHDGTQRVPLIIKPAADINFQQGTRDHLVTNVDMPPTLAALADLPIPERWQGESLVPLFQDSDHNWRDAIVFDHGLYTAQRAVRTADWKYIRTLNPGMWGSVVPDEQLYQMSEDPWEQDNCVASAPQVRDELHTHLRTWVEEFVPETDALQTVAADGPAGTLAFNTDFDGV
ncbi:sulfatase family protein [Halobellus ruber]|uniref:Sulfatase n=1 Tax=Halobellus ruber TaxID=2761102 RepID=A0A7J9SLH6_9EURY|nr:sulfatase [Halobellus ruber]MBB6647775.1 sulfatase [Halobellus ruber]